MEEYYIFDSVNAVRPRDVSTEKEIDAWLMGKLEDISAGGNWELVGIIGEGRFIFKRQKFSHKLKL